LRPGGRGSRESALSAVIAAVAVIGKRRNVARDVETRRTAKVEKRSGEPVIARDGRSGKASRTKKQPTSFMMRFMIPILR
jgi:hypothetical protein